MSDRIESVIISKLMEDDNYCRRVLPFIRPEYFEDYVEQILFNEINRYVQEYNTLPNSSIINIELEKRTDITEDSYKKACEYLKNQSVVEYNFEWLLNTTEKWCKDRAVYLSLFEAVKIAEGKSKDKTRDAIPSILQEALSVCFDDHVGHDYIDDFQERYDFYHRKEEKIPFDLDFFNKITKGGLPSKHSTLHWQERVLVNLSSCVTLPVQFFCKVKMFSTLLLKWQRKESQNESMPIC